MDVLDRQHMHGNHSHAHAPAHSEKTPTGDKGGLRTPPQSQMDLPTPPSSKVELSASTQPPSGSSSGQHRTQSTTITSFTDVSTDKQSKPRNDEQQKPTSPRRETSSRELDMARGSAEQSPSIVAHQRKTKRASEGGPETAAQTPAVNESKNASNAIAIDSSATNASETRQRGRTPRRSLPDADEAGPSELRSRTPSPILGSMTSPSGHMSFGALMQPSLEEVQSLLYGENAERDVEMPRPRSVDQDEMANLLNKLDSMGLSSIDADMDTSNASNDGTATELRERQLASMVKKLISHAKKQDIYIDSMEASLHNTRLRSISLLSSVRTSFAQSFAAEYELRARLQAEVDGAKAQARKLSQLLAQSESRNEEAERERAASAEEEVMWQEEMKDHASAYARQQQARARAAHLSQQSQRGPGASSEAPKREDGHANLSPDVAEATTDVDGNADVATLPRNNDSSPALAAGLDEPFEERKPNTSAISALPQSHSDGSLAGLGIVSGSTGGVQFDAPTGSPLSTIIKERNKLSADKRYLKARVRDAEAQRDRLELELKSLRPLLVRGVPSKNVVASQLMGTPTTPGRSQKRERSRRRRQAVMGDAEAEHLLLAARRLQTTRKATEEDRPKTPPPMHSTSATNPRTPKTPRIAHTPRSTAAPDSVVMQSAASTSRATTDGQVSAPDASPLAGRDGAGAEAAALGRWGSHQRVDSARSAGGIDDLLQAAQSVLTPGDRLRQEQGNRDDKQRSIRYGLAHDSSEGDDDEIAEAEREALRRKEHSLLASSIDESPKRRRVSSAAPGHNRRRSLLSMSPDKSAFVAKTAARRVRNHTEGADHPLSLQSDVAPQASQASALSALDLLADQAAASQVPSQSSEQSNSGEGEPFTGERGSDGEDSEDGMHVDHLGPNGTPRMAGVGAQYYPRNSYGHVYGPPPVGPPGPMPHHHATGPMGHDGYRMSGAPGNPAAAAAGYAYGPGGSPVALTSSSHGWTSQNVPPGRNGIYSPPASQHARFLQSGPRISSGYVTNMQEGSRLAKSNQPAPRSAASMTAMMMNGNGGQMGMYDDDVGEGDEEGSGGSGHAQRTPQKGGNTSPDKRLPYVRWSEEEDAKLRRAIGEYGQRWESVARVVGTRTYHQCRQRYLLMRRKEAAAREGGGVDGHHAVTSSPVS